jgi:predicted dehydrogenase
MSMPISSPTSRRDFLKNTGRLAAASALAGVALPHVHAASSDQIQVALVGCGGRGSGAVVNALTTSKQGPIKLVAMADVFPQRVESSYNSLNRNHAQQMDVPPERRFVGFDSYKKAMDCLRPGDIMISASPPAFRWVHFQYAIDKGLHAFMEKPVTVDAPTSKRMFALNEQAKAKNLKVGIGLMSRHSRALQAMAQRIHDGEIGDIIMQRGYRMHGPVGFFASTPKPPGISDLHYQVQRFHSFLWASGGAYSDFYIHIIDHLSWMKNALPVRVHALGARHYQHSPDGAPYVDQNMDVYGVEYTYPDGTKLIFNGRCMTGCLENFSSAMHGTKGSAIVSRSGDCGFPSTTFRGHTMQRADRIWQSPEIPGQQDPYQNEWDDLVQAIRNDKPFNEVQYGVEASLITSMGRMAAHTGQEITYEDFLNHNHEMAPGLDQITADSPAPLQAGPDGRYPAPQPGVIRDREYGA